MIAAIDAKGTATTSSTSERTMPDPHPSLAEHQLTVIRAFLRQRFPSAELIDPRRRRGGAPVHARPWRREPAHAPRAARPARGPALAALLTEALVLALTRAGARPVTLTAKGIRLEREPQGRVRWLKPADERRQLEACGKSRTHRLADVVAVALETGLRKAEAARAHLGPGRPEPGRPAPRDHQVRPAGARSHAPGRLRPAFRLTRPSRGADLAGSEDPDRLRVRSDGRRPRGLPAPRLPAPLRVLVRCAAAACRPSRWPRPTGRADSPRRQHKVSARLIGHGRVRGEAEVNHLIHLVPKRGLEPRHPCGHMALNLARLPIPPLRHGRAP